MKKNILSLVITLGEGVYLSWMSSAIMVPGGLLMFINFPALLKKKIPKDKDLGFKGFLLAGLIFILIMTSIYLFAYLTR
ncbi:hypothetical protein KKC65_02715 [Patescibacteria group bacterium]|nr:hypothetical protein [Patescibacteria group bacterium]